MLIRGTDLSPRQREQVLNAFGYRWTHENARRTYGGRCPACVQSPHPYKPGRNYTEAGKAGAAMSQEQWHAYHSPVISDAEWLAKHAFNFTKDGKKLGRGGAEPLYMAGGKKRHGASPLKGRGRQKCVHCDKPSIPGMKKGQGLCQTHWNLYAFGKLNAEVKALLK